MHEADGAVAWEGKESGMDIVEEGGWMHERGTEKLRP